MKTLHTPAPWHYRSSAHSKSTFGISIFHGTAPYEEGLIADLSGRYKSYRTEAEIDPSTIANARLIAAAPELLSALESLLEDHKRMFPEAHPHSTIKWAECVEVKQAQQVITKVKGKTLQ